MKINADSTPFALKSSNETFLQRQKDVFDQLNNLKTTLKNNSVEDMDVDGTSSGSRQDTRDRSSRRSPTKHFRGKESIFKRPQEPVIDKKRFFRNIPDFKKNPHKWKKYSLDDVKDEDMSDKSNTKAALSFLNELKNRKGAESLDDDHDDDRREGSKILFRKVFKVDEAVKNSQSSGGSLDDDKPSFRSSKVVMPEYVVGQKAKKDKKNKSIKAKTSSSAQLKLDHLLEDD